MAHKTIIRRYCSCSANDFTYCYIFFRSVVCRSDRLHSCLLLKPLDGFICYSASTLFCGVQRHIFG